tara:strand:+ start:149 stop:610 length:462 start_codon:yes stop_codon:yes gene_type:complete
MKDFPPSPFEGHAFVENPADGSMMNELSLNDWHVIIQRDGTIRGPRPVGRYRLRHLGGPSDVMGLHIVDVQPQSEKDRYERMESDILVYAKGAKQDSSKSNDKGQTENKAEDEAVRPVDPFLNGMKALGVVGVLGALAIGAVTEFVEKLEKDA